MQVKCRQAGIDFMPLNSLTNWLSQQVPRYRLLYEKLLIAYVFKKILPPHSVHPPLHCTDQSIPTHTMMPEIIRGHDVDISAFQSNVVVDLWQSLSEWHLLLSVCVVVCRCKIVGA